MTKDEFTRAFALGFMVTREGFNFECPYDQCAPMIVERNPTEFDGVIDFSDRDYKLTISFINNNADVARLRDKAFEVFSSINQFGIKGE